MLSGFVKCEWLQDRKISGGVAYAWSQFVEFLETHRICQECTQIHNSACKYKVLSGSLV